MKTKPNRQQRHKASNTFTFKKFSEKVRELRVSARKFILRRERGIEEDVTFFHQAMSKQRELNLTKNFQTFQDSIGREIVTTAQLIHHQDHIAACLKKHLDVQSSPALSALLDLVVAFANDDPQGFYQHYFYKFLPILKKHLKPDQPKQLESVFLCIVSLFVVLQKYLRDDMLKLYRDHHYGNLLSVKHKWYINELAANSLSFLIRKLPDKENFLTMAVQKMEKEQIIGVGKMFSSIMKSDVVQRLHSSTSEVLEILLNLQHAEGVPQDFVKQSVRSCVGNIAHYVADSLPDKANDQAVSWKEDSKMVWPVVWNHLQSLLVKAKTSENSEDIHDALQVVRELMIPKGGMLVTDLNEALMNFVAVVETPLSDTVGNTVCDMIHTLLTSPHHDVTHTRLHQTVQSVLLSKYSHSVKLTFVKKVLEIDRFDSVILPLLLDYSNRIVSTSNDPELQKNVISILASIILTKQMPCRTGHDLSSWEKYPLDFTLILSRVDTSVETSIPSYIEQKLGEGIQDDAENIEELMLALICMPHISPLDHNRLQQQFKKILKASISMLTDEGDKILPCDEDEDEDMREAEQSSCDLDLNLKCDISLASRRVLFLLGSIMEAMTHMLDGKDFLSCLKKCSLLDVLIEKPFYRENVHFLRAIDMHLTIASMEHDEELLNEDNLRRIYPALAPVLASTNPMARLFVTRILSSFPVLLSSSPDSTMKHESMFEVMKKAEEIGVSPFTCRDRLRFLNMISGDQLKFRKPECKLYDQAPLLFFFGHLYINYKDLWEPCQSVIADIAHTLPVGAFWSIWFTKLRIVTQHSRNPKSAECSESLGIDNVILKPLIKSILNHEGYRKLTRKPDHQNCRELMWRTMGMFTHVCEAQSNDLVSVFFDFLRQEANYEMGKSKKSLHRKSIQALTPDKETKPEKGEALNTTESFKTAVGKKIPLHMLKLQLSLFAKFTKPRNMEQSDRLEDFYNELLSFVAPSVQRHALECIMSYNYSFLTPYKKYLFGIIDHKTYKKNLLQFSIEGPDQVLIEDHRKNLMPYLMRILYGKMNSKSGLGPKETVTGRRIAVLRYLAGARENELQTFIGLAFSRIMAHLDCSTLEVVRKCKTNKIKRFTLKNLQGCLNTLDSIIKRVGNVLKGVLPTLLKILLLIMTQVTVRLEERSDLKSDELELARKLRKESHRRLTSFFEQYELYNWSSEEIDAVFEAAVWPNLKHLPVECAQTPPALLRLFSYWTQNPRYFILLSKCHHEDNTLTPMPYIVELLNHPKINQEVKEFILDMVENLVTLEDFEESEDTYGDEKPKPLVCSPTIPVEKLPPHDGEEEMNFGTALLIPHVQNLMKTMKGTLQKLDGGVDVDQRDFVILTNLAMWVTNEENSNALVSVIIPLITKRKLKDPEQIPELLKVCSHLLPAVKGSVQYVKPIVAEFGTIDCREGREALCTVISVIASTNPEITRIAEAAKDLNSWNPQLMEEVDYERIFAAYDKFKTYCADTETIDPSYCQLFLYNSMYFIRKGEDSSLREFAVLALKQMLDMLVKLQLKNKNIFTQLVEHAFLKEIRIGLQSENDDVRSEIILLFRQLVLKCHKYVVNVQSLVKLTDTADVERDFFCKVSSIHLQKRAQAMTKLANDLNKKAITVPPHVIRDYLLPIVTSYLFERKYVKNYMLISSSIECIGAFAKAFPWKLYQKLLNIYLKKIQTTEIRFLKDAVKILEVILDGFHEEVTQPIGEDKDDMQTNADEETMQEDDNEMENAPKKIETVYDALAFVYIPRLQKVLEASTKADKEHKVNKSRHAADDDIKRIPLALALVKLLNKLPVELLDDNINGVLMKVVNFLKSQDETVRDEARNTIVKIMVEVGGGYLSWLVKDMRSVLQWGFQAHVLVFTLHAVLSELRPVLEAGHVNGCLTDMIHICKQDILGVQAEEKKVAGIVNKVKEARSDKGYAILTFTAQYISAEYLQEIIMPIKDILSHSQDKTVIDKMVKSMSHISTGLERNKNIDLRDKVVFIYGMLNDKIITLTGEKGEKDVRKQGGGTNRSDSFLLAPEPKKARLNPKTSIKATGHVLIEFSVHFLSSLLKNKKFLPESKTHLELLDPFLKVLGKCIDSEYPEICANAMRCVHNLINFALPSLEEELGSICKQIFLVLHKFSSPELTKGKIFDLVQLAFRTIATIIKSDGRIKFDQEQLSIILHYMHGNINDRKQQPTVHVVLQAIIAQKIDIKKLHELMDMVKDMSITCGGFNELQQARSTFFAYFLTYPMKPEDVKDIMNYYLGNISFARLDGRMSAALMISNIVTEFPLKFFTEEMEANIWFKVSNQLVLEEDFENKNVLQKILRTLFLRSGAKAKLVDLCVALLIEKDDASVESNSAAIQIAGKALLAFLDVDPQFIPEKSVAQILSRVVTLLHPKRYHEQFQSKGDGDDVELNREVCHIDSCLVALIEIFSKLSKIALNRKDWKNHINPEVWEHVQRYLFYPHIKVRAISAGIIGNLLSAYPVHDKIAPPLANCSDKARSLALDLCEQLQTISTVSEALLTELTLCVTRNLIYLVRNSVRAPLVTFEDEDGGSVKEGGPTTADKKVVSSALWILTRVGKMAYKEKRFEKYNTTTREAFLNLIAGLTVMLGDKVKEERLLAFIIAHVANEISNESAPHKLAEKTKEVAALLKEQLGTESFTRSLAKAQSVRAKNKLQRKAHDIQQKAINPAQAAMKKKLNRKRFLENKKRKIVEGKGKVFKKRKNP